MNNIIQTIINKPDNSLTPEDSVLLETCYIQFKDVIKKTIENSGQDIVNSFPFWLKLVTDIMKVVDISKTPGVRKKDIVIEVVCAIVEYEVEIDDGVKNIITTSFRNLAPTIIDTTIEASLNININSGLLQKICSLIPFCK